MLGLISSKYGAGGVAERLGGVRSPRYKLASGAISGGGPRPAGFPRPRPAAGATLTGGAPPGALAALPRRPRGEGRAGAELKGEVMHRAKGSQKGAARGQSRPGRDTLLCRISGQYAAQPSGAFQ